MATIVAVADPDPAARQHAAAQAGSAAAFDSFEKLLSECAVEAAVITVPPMLHAASAIACLNRGIHIYLEKPIAPTLAEAVAIHAEWKKAGVVGRMGFDSRFNPLCGELRQAVRNGECGDIVALRTTFTTQRPDPLSWRDSVATGGGALLDLASHHVDLVRFLLDDEIESVQATVWTDRESAALQLVTRKGHHAQILVALGTTEENSIEIFGTKGKLRMSRYDSFIVERTGLAPRGALPASIANAAAQAGAIGYGVRKLRSPGSDPSFAESISQFLVASRDGVSNHPDIADVLRAAEVLDAARTSSAEGRTIHLAV